MRNLIGALAVLFLMAALTVPTVSVPLFRGSVV